MPSLAIFGALAALQAPGVPAGPNTQDHWASYQRELPVGTRIAAIYTVEPQALRFVFFSRNMPARDREAGSFEEMWFALRDSYGGEEAPSRLWLTGEECPTVYGVLDWLSDIVIPSISTGVRRLPAPSGFSRPLPPRPVHGTTHMIEGYGWTPENDSVRVTMSSSAGLLAQWGDSTQTGLDPCWRTSQPTLLD